jgi:hypothetical protein
MLPVSNNDDAESALQPMPLLSISSRETIEICRDLPLLDNDIFICSYPKSGTTWLQHIILTLVLLDNHESNIRRFPEKQLVSIQSIPSANSSASPMYQHVSDYAPFFEIDAHWDTNEVGNNVHWIRNNHAQLGRRIYNTHLRFDMLPTQKSTQCNATATASSKFIYIVRSPLDTCVSFYAHLSNQVEGGYKKTIDEFFVERMNGKIAYGSWDDHLLSYMVAFSNSTNRTVTLNDGRQFLLILYEEMIENLSNVVALLVEFLELDIPLNVHQQYDLLQHFSFEYMRQHIDHFQPKSVTWSNQFTFLRGGRTGDGNKTLTATQQEEYDRYLKHRNVPKRLSALLMGHQPNVEVHSLISPYVAIDC